MLLLICYFVSSSKFFDVGYFIYLQIPSWDVSNYKNSLMCDEKSRTSDKNSLMTGKNSLMKSHIPSWDLINPSWGEYRTKCTRVNKENNNSSRFGTRIAKTLSQLMQQRTSTTTIVTTTSTTTNKNSIIRNHIKNTNLNN